MLVSAAEIQKIRMAFNRQAYLELLGQTLKKGVAVPVLCDEEKRYFFTA